MIVNSEPGRDRTVTRGQQDRDSPSMKRGREVQREGSNVMGLCGVPPSRRHFQAAV
jgi:hypothetical protein